MAAQEIMTAALGIFIATYLLIAFERLHRVIAALLGAILMSFLLIMAEVETHDENKITFTHLISNYIHWSTLIFIIGMMIIVSIAGRSGVFQYLALRLVKITNGDPIKLFFMFLGLTFTISFVLDTITTMLVVAPLTIEVYKALEYDYKSILITEALAADFSSVGSLVGSIENIIIGQQTNLTFLDFFFYLQPLAFLFLLSVIPVFYLLNRTQFQRDDRIGIEGVYLIEASTVIEDKKMFWGSILTILIVLLGFILSQITALEPALVALAGATFLLAFSGEPTEKTFNDIEWNVIFFLIGLFTLIGGLEILGVIESLADNTKPVLEDEPLIGIIVILWSSALLSGAIDNIPVSATLVIILKEMGIGGLYGKFLYFSLISGVNVGGNILPIASPANIVALTLAEKDKNRITFYQFTKIGILISSLHLVIASIYLCLLYLILTI